MAARPPYRYLTALFRPAHYRTARRLPFVVEQPVDFMLRYVFGRGRYPVRVHVRGRHGVTSLTAHSADDIVTIAEVFCRRDYAAPDNIRTVVDLGANIGISATYFLTRNTDVKVWCFEPAPQNIPRIRQQLAPFDDRVIIEDCAVGPLDGKIDFGIEPTGRYGSTVDIDRNQLTRISVPCRSVNTIVEDVLRERGEIDVLKLDIEGTEVPVIAGLRPELLARIRLIVFEGGPAPALHPAMFDATYSEPINRLSNRKMVPPASGQRASG